MVQSSLTPTNKIILGIFSISTLVIVLYYVSDSRLIPYSGLYADYAEQTRMDVTLTLDVTNISTQLPRIIHDNAVKDNGFLVRSTKCRIRDVDPFNPDAKKYHRPKKYTSCTKLNLLTYLNITDNTATLHVDQELVPSYTKSGVTCCYSNVIRESNGSDPDKHISISKCIPFKNEVTLTLPTPVVSLKCRDKKSDKLVYENVHTAVTITEDVRAKIENTQSSSATPVSLLFIGIDSISRLNLIRSLPHTYQYLERNQWVALKGYNKVADNTFPNLMAIFTGYNESVAYRVCNPVKAGKLDNCSIIWKDYSKFGWITAYAEDEAKINTFNYNKKGFIKPPTDYYFRPYMMAAERLKKVTKDKMTYCTGPETSAERILNVARDFAVTFRDYPNFGFFWMNTFSHNDINSPSGMDLKIKTFLESLEHNSIYNKSVVVFLSDHGIRFGKIRYTRTGWYEERLPFIYFSFPPWFKETFPGEFQNFIGNINKLTTPYDFHMTLQHILVLSGFNYTIKPSDACPNCKSLLENIEEERSCKDAAIAQHWCTCEGYTSVNSSSKGVQTAAKYFVGYINEIIRSKSSTNIRNCAKYVVKRIVTSAYSQKMRRDDDKVFLLLVIETRPSAVFEATIALNNTKAEGGDFNLAGDISRLDSYQSVSHCVKNAYLKKYCYCL